MLDTQKCSPLYRTHLEVDSGGMPLRYVGLCILLNLRIPRPAEPPVRCGAVYLPLVAREDTCHQLFFLFSLEVDTFLDMRTGFHNSGFHPQEHGRSTLNPCPCHPNANLKDRWGLGCCAIGRSYVAFAVAPLWRHVCLRVPPVADITGMPAVGGPKRRKRRTQTRASSHT